MSFRSGLFSFLCFVILFATGARAQDPIEIVFIVNSENPAEEISIADIRDYYYKIKKKWPNGESVRFIDRSAQGVRETFLKKILQKSNSDVELFWIGQKLYTGNSAPLRELSDRATIQFVASFKGAIGYISAGSALNVKNIKILKPERSEE